MYINFINSITQAQMLSACAGFAQAHIIAHKVILKTGIEKSLVCSQDNSVKSA